MDDDYNKKRAGLQACTTNPYFGKNAAERRAIADHEADEFLRARLQSSRDNCPAGTTQAPTPGESIKSLIVALGIFLALLLIGSLILEGVDRIEVERKRRAQIEQLRPMLQKVAPAYGDYVRPTFRSPTDDAAYLAGMPSVRAVKAVVTGPTALDAAVRLHIAFNHLAKAMDDLIGQRRLQSGAMTPAERALKEAYRRASADAEATARRLGRPATLDLLAENLRFSNSLVRLVWEKTSESSWRTRYFVNWARFEMERKELLAASQLSEPAPPKR